MWCEHCSYKSSRPVLARPADQRSAGPPGAGRERRRDRHRRRPGGGLQDREPQPSLVHRALPGRGDRGRRHPARRLHHGRAPDRASSTRCASAASTIRAPATWSAAWSPASAATATASACRRSAARSTSTRATTRTSWSTPSPRAGAGRPDLPRQRRRRRQPGDLRRLEDRPRRHPRRQPAGLGRVRRDQRAEATRRSRSAIRSPRSCCIEACLELMEKDAIVGIQDMGAAGLTSSSVEMAARGGARHRHRPRPGAEARGRACALRDPALRVAGAHADRRPRRRRARGAWRSSAAGTSTRW